MSNYLDNVMKTLAAGVAALVVTWVMSYGMVESTKHVRNSVSNSVLVAVIRN
jgi:hypothetical protein